MTLKFDGWPWKTIRHLFYATSSFVHHFVAISQFKLELQYGNAHFGSKSAIFFIPCDLEISWMTLKNNRAPILCYFKLCASFHNHRLIPTQLTVRKRPIWVKIDDFLPRLTLKIDSWPWKTIGHLFDATSSIAHNLTTIGLFQLELQSGNAQFGSKCAIFGPVWQMTLRNSRAPLQCYFKHCAPFHNHRFTPTRVIVRKRPIWVKIGNFWSRVALKFDGWP